MLARPLRVFLWSYVFLYAVFCSLSITQVDVWWQLAEGEHILHTGELPGQPAAAFGLPATPYFDEYAGYEVVLALLYHVTGFIGLWLVFSTIFLLIMFLPGATNGRKYPVFDLPSILALAVAVLLTHPRMVERPELVAVLCQVLLMVLLRASSLEKITARLLVGLVLLFVVWSNVHSTFLFGLLTLGLWIANEWWRLFRTLPLLVLLRRSGLLVFLALVASVLTPYGPERLLFPFMQATDPGATALSPEMWPIPLYPSVLLGLLLFCVALMVWGILMTPGMPLWLIAFSVFAVVISIGSARFLDFAAVALLFLYAQRDLRPERAARPLAYLPGLALDLALCFLILFALFMDAFTVVTNYNELRAEPRLATHTLRYASDMAEYPAQGRRVPVLCGLGVGSYLSFPGHGDYRPLLDSGLIHFDSDTKRYFFFTWLEPEALTAALNELHAGKVILDADTFSWIPTLRRNGGWQYVTCSANGMIWKRNSGGPHPLNADEQAQIREAIARLRQRGNASGAFDFSTLVDRPADSLALLVKDSAATWKETFFNSLCAWVDLQPDSEIQAFLASHSCATCPLLGAILSARLGPEAYDHFIAAHPDGTGVWYGKAIATEVLLRKGDATGARRVFASIWPVPVSSTAYYRLWHEIHAQDQPAPELSAYGRWQTWDAGAKNFLEEMSARLNDRISSLDEKSSR